MVDPENVLQAEKQAAADRAQQGINTRMPNPSSYAINCVFFAIYLNSMAAWLDIVTAALIDVSLCLVLR